MAESCGCFCPIILYFSGALQSGRLLCKKLEAGDQRRLSENRPIIGGASRMKTHICEMLGVDFPLVAFSHCRDVVAAVSRAGGFGVLGATAFAPDQLELELKWIDDHIDGKPYGVDIVMPMSYVGKGGDTDASLDNLEAMIPQQHRDYVEHLLD